MNRLSSNITLVLKLFLPTFWVSFFGLFGVAIFATDSDTLGLLGQPLYQIGYIIFFIVFLLFFYFTIFQLKRVEEQEGELYITDYFKTIKVSLGSVDKISETNLLLCTLVSIKMKNKGVFGKNIRFIAKISNYKTFVSDHASFFSTF